MQRSYQDAAGEIEDAVAIGRRRTLEAVMDGSERTCHRRSVSAIAECASIDRALARRGNGNSARTRVTTQCGGSLGEHDALLVFTITRCSLESDYSTFLPRRSGYSIPSIFGGQLRLVPRQLCIAFCSFPFGS